MKIASFSRVRNEIRICNDILIIFIFESQTGVWSRVELRHEFGPLYRFHIHNLLEVTNARKLLPRGENFGLGCSKSGYNPWIIQK